MANSMIRIERLSKRYGTTEALKGLSFEVPRGQVVGFLGPNGAGKSTTMRILAGFVTPSGGTARVGDVDVLAEPVRARRLIGYLPENNPLYEEMMVADFLRFVAIGSGTDVAISTADVVLLSGGLRALPRVLRLARATLGTIRQNLFWAFIYNVAGIPVAAGALVPVFGLELSPVFASAAMSLSSVSVLANSLRLRRFEKAGAAR